jgi:hypothetical protein
MSFPRILGALSAAALVLAPMGAHAEEHGSRPVGGRGSVAHSAAAPNPQSRGSFGIAPPVHSARPIPGYAGPRAGGGWSGRSENGFRTHGQFERGDRDHDLDDRGGARFFHGRHRGHFGWWWINGGTWYPYGDPLFPYDDFAAPALPSPGYWYWCESAQAYYPYVSSCPEGWQLVVPQPPDAFP